MFYTSKIKFFNFTRKKTCEWQPLRMEYVCLVYCEQNVSFCAIIISRTYSLLFFCENSSVISGKNTEKVFFPSILDNFTTAQFFFTSTA